MCRIAVLLALIASFMYADLVTFDENSASQPLFSLLDETPAGLEIVFSMHEMVVEAVMIDGVSMKTYGVPAVFMVEPGKPCLAGASRYIAIPQGAKARITILDARTETYGDVEVAPASNLPREDDDSPLRYEKDMSVYNQNAYYPTSPVRLSKPMKMRGLDVVILGVIPFQYNPVSKELIVYKDIRLRVDFVGGNGHFGEDRLRSRFWEPVLRNHLMNYGSLPQIDFFAPERINNRDGFEYVIIVADDTTFAPLADTLKLWRRNQGISCEVFTLNEIGGSTIEAIENFLDSAYTNWTIPPAAFLMLGDYPNSGDNPGIIAPTYYHATGWCVSDNWYADVDGDHLPDMYHGRICARSQPQLQTIVNKLLSYERNPYTAANFYNNPLAACGWQDDRWFQICSETIRHFFINELGKDPAREYNVWDGEPASNSHWTTRAGSQSVIRYWVSAGWLPDTINPYSVLWWDVGSAAGVNNAINSGAFLVQHRDHALVDGWWAPPYTLDDMNNLTNDMYPFVISTNCLTGAYDNPTQVFAEKLHRIPHGASSVNAASNYSTSFVNDTYIWGMYDYFWPQFDAGYPAFELYAEQNWEPCMAMISGKYYLEAMWFPDSVPGLTGYRIPTYHLFHHFGDVFQVMYSELPQQPVVDHPPVLTAGATAFSVAASANSVIALTAGGEIIGAAQGTGAPVAIPIIPQAAGDTMKVTVTMRNHYRYEMDVPVVSTMHAHVTWSGDVIDDAGGGNGDGIVNPGEIIDYGVWAKNIGTGTSYGVYGIVSENDDFITVTADSCWYGDISAGDSVLSSPSYIFSVAGNCRHGHEIEFIFDFVDVNDSINTTCHNVEVVAPHLIREGHTVLSANSILDPGETVDLELAICNEGGATAVNVTAILTTNSSYITIVDSACVYGSIEPGVTVNNANDPYTVTASISTPIGTVVDFSIIVEAGVYVDTLDLSLMIGETVPTDTGYYYAYYADGLQAQSPVFEWVAIDSTQTQYPGTSLDLNDNHTGHVALPFTFRYYGQDYIELSICSNGWVAPGYQATIAYYNKGIPDPSQPSTMIAGLWDDLDPGNTGMPSDIYYYFDAPNHRFIVEYFMVEHHPGGSPETFEIILYDPAYYPTPTGDGEIVIQYLNAMHQWDNTVGIEDQSESIGIQYYLNSAYHQLAAPITDSFALKFTTSAPLWGIEDYTKGTPFAVTMLHAPYPNPFRQYTDIRYQITDDRAACELKIYDITGRLVCDLSGKLAVIGYQSSVSWDGTDQTNRKLSSGVYFVRLVAGDYNSTKKVLLIR
jgi:hypothetical protein